MPTDPTVSASTSSTAAEEDIRGIIDATTAMAVLADDRNWAALTAVFTDEVTVDYTALTGGHAGAVSATDLVAGWTQALGAFTATHHLLGNHQVTLRGATAMAHAYFQATHVRADGSTWVLGGRYRYWLERRAGGWRISALTMTPTWSHDGVNALPRPATDAGTR